MKQHGRTVVVAASAGTGKTTRLTEELKRRLLDPDEAVAPERVVAVTFTRAAAAHLTARVRQALLAAGAPAVARRLAAARIGTVHAVCGRLVDDFALELGLSPDLRVLDEALAERNVRLVLEEEVGDEERAVLEELGERLGDFDWTREVRNLITLVRANGLDAEGLARSAETSVDSLVALLPPPIAPGELEERLGPVLDKVLAGPAPRSDAMREEWRELAEMRRTLARQEPLSWGQWWHLEQSRWDALRALGKRHLEHPGLRQDLSQATRLVFEITGRALARYREQKVRIGAVDFVDQEVEALRLLRDPRVRERLREDIELVLVDEFQDTSPIQVAILGELASLARHSFFVGDPKQSIFGFRGTDPRLMQAVIEQLATVDDVLAVSHRSRPGLVALSSALFAPPFERQGIAPERVHVTASLTEEPAGLGCFLERWALSPGAPDPAEIASGVAALLDDADLKVRERGAVVPLRPGHIAILARKNKFARRVAVELARLGIPSVLRRGGLCATLEARALMAGLALFVDGCDSLAAAELTRLTRGAADPSAWLAELLKAPRGSAFLEEPLVQAVRATAEAQRSAGVVSAVDRVVEALRLRDACVAWGDTALRLANLGALRVLAVRFVEESLVRGAGATVTGFLTSLEELADAQDAEEARENQQGDVAGEDAVHIVTWHASKGREWPLVVLTQLEDANYPNPFGAHVETDAARVDLAAPLSGRRVRFWPKPYPWRAFHGGLLDRAAASDAMHALRQRTEEEELRLLYVGWTRARDRLVLAGNPSGHSRYDLWRGSQSLLRHLRSAAGPALGEPDAEGRATWGGVKVALHLRAPRPREERPPEAGLASVPVPLPPGAPVPAFVQPSSLQGEGVGGAVHVIGPPVALAATPGDEAMTALGSAVHGFLAADHGLDEAARLQLAAELLGRFEVAHLLDAAGLAGMGARLVAALQARFPDARLLRERPLWQRLDTGSVVRGQIDLLVDAPGGFVVVDHKTYQGLGELPAGAAGFAAQLDAYARALQVATGRPVLGLWVHLPLQGALVEVSVASPAP